MNNRVKDIVKTLPDDKVVPYLIDCIKNLQKDTEQLGEQLQQLSEGFSGNED